MKAMLAVALVLAFVAFCAVLAADQTPNPVPPGWDQGSGNAGDIDTRPPELRITNTWDGSFSTNWHTASNWSLNHAPLSTEDVVIPVVTANRYPALSADGVCNSLTESSGASLSINACQLNVTTGATLNGSFSMTGDSDFDVYGDLVFGSGSSASISEATPIIFVQGDIEFLAGSNINIPHTMIDFYGTADTFIRTYAPTVIGSIYAYKPTSGCLSISNLSNSTLTVGYLTVASSTLMYHPYAGTTVIQYSLLFNDTCTAQFNDGTLSFEGNQYSSISDNDGDCYLNNLTINKDSGYTATLQTDLTVRGNLTIQSGTLSCGAHNLKVGGNWNNTQGVAYFLESTGRVTFNGTAHQYCNNTENFNILEVNKSAGAFRVNSSTAVVTCASYDWTAGAVDVLEGTFAANNLADNCFKGGWYLNTGGTINVTTTGYIDLSGDFHIFGGTFNVYGGSLTSYWPYNNDASIEMSGGILEFHDRGIWVFNSVWAFTESISGGTIRSAGNFVVDRAEFTPTGGTVEMTGSLNAMVSHVAGANLYTLRINKAATRGEEGAGPVLDIDREGNEREIYRDNSVIASSDLDLNGTFYIESGYFFAPPIMNVRGSWYNYVGPDGFSEGTGLVVFDGNASSSIYCNEVFNDLELNKSVAAARLSLSTGFSATCTSYDWTVGTLYVTGGTFTANDLVDDGIYGLIDLSAGTINFHQETSSYVDLNGTLTQSGGTFNIFGGMSPAYFGYNGPAVLNLSGGVLDFKGTSVEFRASDDFTNTVSGGTIRTVRNFHCGIGDFNPTGGTIELYGSLDCGMYQAAGSNFHHVVISKGATREEEYPLAPDRNGDGGGPTRANTVTANSDLDINGDFTLQAGTFIAPAAMSVGGTWTKAAGGTFTHSSGTVTFNQAGDIQYVNGANNFHNVTDAHTGGTLAFEDDTTIAGTLTCTNIISFHAAATLNSVVNTISSAILAFFYNHDSTIASYNGGGSLRAWAESYVAITDLATPYVKGSYLVAGHLEIHQVVAVGQYIDLNCVMTISGNGIVDLYGGNDNCYVSNSANTILTMTDNSQLNIKDWGIRIYNSATYTCALNISGGTIRVNGNWHDERGIFNPTGGTVEFTGTADNTVSSHASSWFWTLKVNKAATRDGGDPEFTTDREGNFHPVTRTSNLTIGACTVKGGYLQQAANAVYLGGDMNSLNAGNVTISSGVLHMVGHDIISTGNVVINNSVLAVDAGSSLKVSNGKAITVNTGGELLLPGDSVTASSVTHNGAGYYGLNVENGGTLSASYGIFEYMDANGIWLKPGSLMGAYHPLDHCTFRNGASGGRLLQVNNSQDLTVVGAYFPANTWSGAYNVTKSVDSGLVYFSDWSGDFGGPAFELDTNNRLWWQGSGIPPIEDLSISYLPATNQIQLNWSYPLAATSYKVYRALDPFGTYFYMGTTVSNSWSQTVPGPIFFYHVTALMP